MKGHFIRTSFSSGLTDSLAERAIEILKQQQISATTRPAEVVASAPQSAEPQRPSKTGSALLTTKRSAQVRVRDLAGLWNETDVPASCQICPIESLDSLYELLDSLGRVAFLSKLGTFGLALKHRQALANAMGRVRREGRLVLEH